MTILINSLITKWASSIRRNFNNLRPLITRGGDYWGINTLWDYLGRYLNITYLWIVVKPELRMAEGEQAGQNRQIAFGDLEIRFYIANRQNSLSWLKIHKKTLYGQEIHQTQIYGREINPKTSFWAINSPQNHCLGEKINPKFTFRAINSPKTHSLG